MQRFIALDIGKKRTGIALVDDAGKVATPIEVIGFVTSSEEFLKSIISIIDEWEPTSLIAGLPIDLKGEESIAAQDVRQRCNSLVQRINEVRMRRDQEPLELVFVDERLTTKQAERTMMDADMSAIKRKNLRDALAAAVIAQSFIDSL